MIKFLVIFLVFSFGQSKAAHQFPAKIIQKQVNFNAKAVDTSKNMIKGENSQTKFFYAELYYQKIYTDDKIFVNGNSLSEALIKSVAEAKYKSSALDLMGAQGWELSSTIYRDIREGYEIIFYFKKRID